MLKRTNKITALLLAATSVMSVVPAMASDSTTRLGTKTGTIENAVAYKDGKYVYQGYKDDSDNDSVYYNAGDKDKELTDVKDSDIEGAYSDKYAFAKDGSDEYLVDLTDGKQIDDDSPSDRQDTAATKLKSNAKKADRYGNDLTVDSSDLTRLENGSKFGDTWYQYGVTSNTGDASDYLIGGKLYGYTNDNGKYIDTSYTANIYAYSSEKDRVVKIDNFSNKPADYDTDTKLQAKLVKAPVFLGQDKDNIYQKVTVLVQDFSTNASTVSTTAAANYKVNYPTTTDDAAFKGAKATGTINWGTVGTSKITTGASVTIAGVPFNCVATPTLPTDYTTNADSLKSAVNAYFTAHPATGYAYSNGVFTAANTGSTASAFGGDTTDLVTYVDGKTSTFVVNGVTFTYNPAVTDAQIATGTQQYRDIATLKTAVNNYFTAHQVSNYNYANGVFTYAGTGTSAHTDMTESSTLSYTASNPGGTVTGNSTTAGISLTKTYIQRISKTQGDNKDGGYLPKKVESYELTKDLDCSDADDAVDSDASAKSYTVSNGTLYAIKDSGDNVKVTTMKLMKDKVKFDSATKPAGHNIDDKIDVYLVEKGDDDDSDYESGSRHPYSIDVDGNVWAINEGKIKKFEKGNFSDVYTCDRSLDSLDVYDKSSLIAWEYDKDAYTTVNEGTAQTQSDTKVVTPEVKIGWQQGADGSWTFNDATGTKLVSKWINSNGYWYYLKADGAMATGWIQEGDTWYHTNASGAMQTGWVQDGSNWYYLNASGAMATGWINDGGTWYYSNPISNGTRGVIMTGWQYINGSWYYFSQVSGGPLGAMLSNTTISGYRLGNNGAMI